MDAPVIVWFRDDLRLTDHAALYAAHSTGRPILPVYVLDDEAQALGGAARWWLHHSLAALSNSLESQGNVLTLRRGDAKQIIPALVEATGAVDVFTGGLADPSARATDRAIAGCLARGMSAFIACGPRLCFGRTSRRPKPAVRSVSIRRSRAPAWRWSRPLPCRRLAFSGLGRVAVRPPGRLAPVADTTRLGRRPAGDLDPGRGRRPDRLDRFLAAAIAGYAVNRHVPGIDSTSMLSPHLRFGEISPAQVLHTVRAGVSGEDAKSSSTSCCGENSRHHLLWHHPTLADAPLRPEFAAMPWRDDPRRAERLATRAEPASPSSMRACGNSGEPAGCTIASA